jgi:hypothetical protein
MHYKTFALSLLAVSLFGCTQKPSTAEATAEFCQNLSTLKQEVATLGSLTPASTVGELNATRDRIQLSMDKLDRSAAVLQNVQVDALKQAEANFKKTVESVSAKTTLADAATQIQQAGAQVEAARVQIASAVQCQ